MCDYCFDSSGLLHLWGINSSFTASLSDRDDWLHFTFACLYWVSVVVLPLLLLPNFRISHSRPAGDIGVRQFHQMAKSTQNFASNEAENVPNGPHLLKFTIFTSNLHESFMSSHHQAASVGACTRGTHAAAHEESQPGGPTALKSSFFLCFKHRRSLLKEPLFGIILLSCCFPNMLLWFLKFFFNIYHLYNCHFIARCPLLVVQLI